MVTKQTNGYLEEEYDYLSDPLSSLIQQEHILRQRQEEFDTCSLEDIKVHMNKAAISLKTSIHYLESLGNVVISIKGQLKTMRDSLSNKLSEEFSPFYADGSHTSAELEALDLAQKALGECAESNIEVAKNEELASKVEESLHRLRAELKKTTRETEHLRDDLETKTENDNTEQEKDFEETDERKGAQELKPTEDEDEIRYENEMDQEGRRDWEKSDPSNFNVFTYYRNDEDDSEQNVVCFIRAPEGVLTQDSITVQHIEDTEADLTLDETEELVSDIINVESYNGNRIKFQELKCAEILVTSLQSMKFGVVTKLKEDGEKFNNKGGKLTSSMDNRISLVIPKRAILLTSTISMKIFPMDSTIVSEIKRTRTSCKHLLSCSHLFFFKITSGQNNFLRPVTLWLPAPGFSRKRPKTGKESERNTMNSSPLTQRPSTALPVSSYYSNLLEDEQEEHIYLMVFSEDTWTNVEDFDCQIKRDIMSFKLQNYVERLVLFRISGEKTPNELCEMVTDIESHLKDKVVSFIVRQKPKDMGQIHVECCRLDETDTILDNLEREEEYSHGPNRSKDVHKKEHEKITVTFRGNITFEDDQDSICFVYNSNKDTAKADVFVKEVDQFAQHALENYRGHVQFWKQGDGEDRILLCELPVILPKPQYQKPCVVRAPVKIDEQGPLTLDLFESLAAHLGAEWRQVAEFLGVNRARVQAIIRDNSGIVHAVPNMVLDMLVYWYKSAPKNCDKVGELYWALKEAQRKDLAEELAERNVEFQQEAEQKAEDEKMRRAFKIVTDQSLVLRNWRGIAEELGLSQDNISEIETRHGGSPREQCRQALLTWRDLRGKRATRKALSRALRNLKIMDAADKVKQLY